MGDSIRSSRAFAAMLSFAFRNMSSGWTARLHTFVVCPDPFPVPKGLNPCQTRVVVGRCRGGRSRGTARRE